MENSKYITYDDVKKDADDILSSISTNGMEGNFGMPEDISYKDEQKNTIFIKPLGRGGEALSEIATEYWELAQREKCDIATVLNSTPIRISQKISVEEAAKLPSDLQKKIHKLWAENQNAQDPKLKLSTLRARLARKADDKLGTNFTDVKIPTAMKKVEEKVSHCIYKGESR